MTICCIDFEAWFGCLAVLDVPCRDEMSCAVGELRRAFVGAYKPENAI